MEDSRWLRLITIGLVLSALAVGYFLLTGRFASTKTIKPAPTAQPSQQVEISKASPSPAALGISSTPKPVVKPIVSTAKEGVNTLPNTGVPVGLALTFATSALAVGYGLRKYPN